jgi:hypothetical protein
MMAEEVVEAPESCLEWDEGICQGMIDVDCAARLKPNESGTHLYGVHVEVNISSMP